MIRIIGGDYRGRVIKQPPTEQTRPVSQRAREAAFNILGDVSGLEVLDLYAGSGIFTFEALSRGARSAVLIDNQPAAITAMTQTAALLGNEARVEIIRTDVGLWACRDGRKFDLIFVDPPFEAFDETAFKSLAAHMNSDATLVFKHQRRQPVPDIDDLEVRVSRRYGSSCLSFYKGL